jgi:hypothetical protein
MALKSRHQSLEGFGDDPDGLPSREPHPAKLNRVLSCHIKLGQKHAPDLMKSDSLSYDYY